MNNTYTAEIDKLSMKYTPIIDSRLLLTADIDYPSVTVLNNPYSSYYISRQYEESSQSFMFDSQNIVYPNKLSDYISSYNKLTLDHYTVLQNYKVMYNKNNIICILLKRKIITNDDHLCMMVSYTNNLITGESIPASELFLTPDYKEKLIGYIKDLVKSDEKKYVDNYEDIIYSSFDENNFYITDNGITVYYPVNSLISDNKTIPVFEISYEKIKDIIKLEL